jgi:DHA2 family multidrug resistance protein-like MFS transporter
VKAGGDPGSNGSGVDGSFGLPTPRRHWASLAIWLAVVMAVLDGAIANVALPTIAKELGTDPAEAIWIVNAYQLAITTMLLPLASLGDRLGYRRIFTVGLVVFTLGSAGCALSQTLPQLVAARVVQGFGAAGLMSINTALLRFTFPNHLLGRGIAYTGVVVSVSSALGPTVASAILAVGSWQWLFAVNIPVGLVAIPLAMRMLPPTPGSGLPFDFLSALLNCVAFGGLILGAESFARDGLVAGLPQLAVGLAAGVLLVRRELPRPAPLVPVDLLRIRIFRLSILTSIASFSAQMLTFVALPFHLQTVLGRTVVETGLLMTPWPLAVALTAPISGRLADRYPAGMLGGIGQGVFAVGLISLAFIPPSASDLDIALRMIVCGVGFGLFQAPNNRTIVAAAPAGRSGAAGGMLSTARLSGQTFGAVLMAVLFHQAYLAPTHAAFVLAGGLAGAATVLSLMRLRGG